jgi:hypothetical protein
VSESTANKYRKIYGPQQHKKAVTDIGMMMSVADYSLSDKELIFQMGISQHTLTKYRKKYAPDTIA